MMFLREAHLVFHWCYIINRSNFLLRILFDSIYFISTGPALIDIVCITEVSLTM